MLENGRMDFGKADISLPKVVNVCGYEIKKMPVGSYLAALKKLNSLPEGLAAQVFPDIPKEQVLNMILTFDDRAASRLKEVALTVIPQYLVGFAAELTGIDEEKILNDPDIGMDGLFDILKAFAEVNNLGKLHGALTAFRSQIRSVISGLIPIIGSKE